MALSPIKVCSLRRARNRWGRERSFDRPAIFESFPNGRSSNPNASFPSGNCVLDAIEFKPMVSGRVAGLHSGVGPSAIPRLVITVVVDAINGRPARARPHVLKKHPRVVPSLANSYSSPAIIRPSLCACVIATLHHAGPSLKPGLTACAVLGSHGAEPDTRLFCSEASARKRPGIERVSPHFLFRTTGTSHKPHPMDGFIGQITDNKQPPNSHPGKVFRGCHVSPQSDRNVSIS